MKEYHSWKLDRAKLIEGPISASMLKRFAPNPYEWLHTPEMAQTAAMRTGSLFDAALTDEAAFEASVVCSPFADFRSKAARDWRDEQAEAGRLVTTQDMIDKALLAAEKCREHEIAGSILEGAQFQIGVVGEIGGTDEEEAARWVKTNMKKPVVGFIAGVTAPPGKRMGHAGAIISGGQGTAAEKLAVMEECGIKVTRNPAEMGKLLKSVLR